MSVLRQKHDPRECPRYTSGFPKIADTTVTWSATWEMSAGSPVIDDVHLQLCRARLVLNQQGNGHDQRGFSQ